MQSFSYRGASRHSLPGEILVLHPDEVHDGHAGSASGFRYRMLYLTPALVQEVLGASRCRFSRAASPATRAWRPPPTRCSLAWTTG
ncbi:AraC family ligand binding domain-containing protein [Pseudomonas qingdaonensis]|nr:AraC family ligand binding domain-containing protein [Pseudomonas qingdaonensis]